MTEKIKPSELILDPVSEGLVWLSEVNTKDPFTLIWFQREMLKIKGQIFLSAQTLGLQELQGELWVLSLSKTPSEGLPTVTQAIFSVTAAVNLSDCLVSKLASVTKFFL